ncbi:MAG: hypothetical protein QME96_15865 [Myxococcota bacterium]|nr:hypothetical protein [Myxococcota bacterium]
MTRPSTREGPLGRTSAAVRAGTGAAALLLLGCASSSGPPADAAPDTLDPVRGCTSAAECAVGVDYRSVETCAQPGPYRVLHVEAEACLTAMGEPPGAGCAACIVTRDSGRGGRLGPGRRWAVACVDRVCTATDEPCPSCPVEGPCDTSLDCFLTYHCRAGTCAWGCDMGFDCLPDQVCVREPPDAAFGRCVLSR